MVVVDDPLMLELSEISAKRESRLGEGVHIESFLPSVAEAELFTSDSSAESVSNHSSSMSFALVVIMLLTKKLSLNLVLLNTTVYYPQYLQT